MTEPDGRSAFPLSPGTRMLFAPLGTPLPTTADLDLTDNSAWVDLGYVSADGLFTSAAFDPGPAPEWTSTRLFTSLPFTATFTVKTLDIGRAGWRMYFGPRPPYGCGWRRRKLTHRQVLNRMHAEYGRRRR